MYHDQGLPVLKAASFGGGVNVTLGLPFIRTSVDHGTALDLALDAERAKTRRPGEPDRGGRARDRAREPSRAARGVARGPIASPAAARSAAMKGHQSRRRFGQNFLVDPHYIERIVAAIDPQPGERIVEIGPGLAALTERLIERAGHLTAVEIDRDLAARLRERFPPDRLTLLEGDALEFDFATLGSDLRVVGNLPYNISSPLLFHLAEYESSVCAIFT